MNKRRSFTERDSNHGFLPKDGDLTKTKRNYLKVKKNARLDKQRNHSIILNTLDCENNVNS